MNSVQIHLALTHVPVVLSFIGLIMFVAAIILKNPVLTKTSYVLLILAGLAALPVFFTGEATEDAVEKLPGVSDAIIERHEEVAKMAMIVISIAGFTALGALFTIKWQTAGRIFKIAVFILAVASGGLMAQTAHLGGQIRHTEIRNGIALQNTTDQNGKDANPEKEYDND